jgi:hypothetical protein
MMKSRRLAVISITGMASLGVFAISITGASAATHGACVLSGTANFSPGLKATAAAQSYTFTGSFSNCEGVSGITGGSVTASGSGSLGCASGSSSGTAIVDWNNGTTSTIPFTTTTAADATEVKGTVSSGTFAGLAAKAAIAFTTSSPQLCATTGLPSAAFKGPAEIGT